MDSKLICYVVCAILSLCDSAYVDTINKCSFKDDECVTKTVQNTVKDIATKGIQELNMPAVDPLALSGLSVPVLGMLNITVLEGSLTGVKDCMINHVHNDFDALVTDLDITCDLTIKTKFKLEDISPVAQKLFGAEATSGSGTLRLKIDKMHMKMKFFVQIIKKDDGEIYIVPNTDNLASDFDIEKLTLTADKILFGNQDLSEIVEKLINENWKTFMPTFGNGVFEVTISIINTFLGNFFNNVPAKNYFIDDLTSYVKNM